MKGLSFWQWLGLMLLISLIGGILYQLFYGKAMLKSNEQLIKDYFGVPKGGPTQSGATGSTSTKIAGTYTKADTGQPDKADYSSWSGYFKK